MPTDPPNADRLVSAALERHRTALHAMHGVVSTGLGPCAADGGACVQIFVRAAAEVAGVEAGARALLGAVPVDVFVVGDVIPGQQND
jgi:hypothetical protein